MASRGKGPLPSLAKQGRGESVRAVARGRGLTKVSELLTLAASNPGLARAIANQTENLSDKAQEAMLDGRWIAYKSELDTAIGQTTTPTEEYGVIRIPLPGTDIMSSVTAPVGFSGELVVDDVSGELTLLLFHENE